MASEAYKRMMNRIPKEIRQLVDFNMDIANEIHSALQHKGKKAKDLALLMNKSESEISKWLTGTHNFTVRTILKIEAALEVEILTTKSKKVSIYEKKQQELYKEIDCLKQECERLKEERITVKYYENTILTEKLFTGNNYFTFVSQKEDNYKVLPLSTSKYNVQRHLVIN